MLVIRADDVTTQMAAAIFKQEEQVSDVIDAVRSVLTSKPARSHPVSWQVLKDIAVYSAVLARTSLAQTPGYEVHLIEELDSVCTPNVIAVSLC